VVSDIDAATGTHRGIGIDHALDSNGPMMSFQLEPSAHAPCTKTTLGFPFVPIMIEP
jgi:hypothetical protein